MTVSLPKVTICGYCGRSLGLDSSKRLPPGEHMGKVVVTKEPCNRCDAAFEEGSVSQADTEAGKNTGGKI